MVYGFIARKYHDFYSLFKKNHLMRSNLTIINFWGLKIYGAKSNKDDRVLFKGSYENDKRV